MEVILYVIIYAKMQSKSNLIAFTQNWYKKIWVDFPLIDDAKVNKLTLIGRLEQIIQLKWFAVLFTLTLHWNSVMEKFSQNKFKFDHQFKLDC